MSERRKTMHARETFLQGSYRNNTAIADIDDVDIVARRRNATSLPPAKNARGKPLPSSRVLGAR
jgi:hypothetical protein